MRFLDLGLGTRVPDEKTIWLFRELLVRAEAIDKLFDRFEAELEGQGYQDFATRDLSEFDITYTKS